MGTWESYVPDLGIGERTTQLSAGRGSPRGLRLAGRQQILARASEGSLSVSFSGEGLEENERSEPETGTGWGGQGGGKVYDSRGQDWKPEKSGQEKGRGAKKTPRSRMKPGGKE